MYTTKGPNIYATDTIGMMPERRTSKDQRTKWLWNSGHVIECTCEKKGTNLQQQPKEALLQHRSEMVPQLRRRMRR